MELITANALIAQCEIPLEEKWGYIYGATGYLWTQDRQDRATDSMARQYGQKWVGRRVVDCSGLFYWAFRELGGYIYHGSNTIWTKHCRDDTKSKLVDGKRPDGKTIRPGSAVFLVRDEGGRQNRHHIGIYIGSNLCIEAKGTRYGVVSSPLAHWDLVAELKDVSYDGEVVRMTLRRGCKGEEVTELQEKLITRGYDPGTVDGIFGTKTENAVRYFQTDNGLTADGIVGDKTWAVLLEGTGTPAANEIDTGQDDQPTISTDVKIPAQLAGELYRILKSYLDVG